MCGRDRSDGELRRSAGAKGGGGAIGKGQARGRLQSGGDERRGEGWRGGAGPLGADGARPQLAWGDRGPRGGQDAGMRGKGKGGKEGKGAAPWAAGKAAGIGAGQGLGGTDGARAAGGDTAEGRDGLGKGKGKPNGARGWARPAPSVDDEGFELVQPRRVRVQGDDDMSVDHSTSQTQQVQPLQAPTVQCSRQRWSDADSDDDDCVDDDCGDDDGYGEGQGDGDEGDQGADPKALKATFDAHARMVRDLERRGPAYRDCPAVATLRAARDAAEAAWREAKAPAPLPIRMGRAEAKLERAATALTRARLAVEEFDEWAEGRREELVRARDEANGWYRWRQQQLDQLHVEAGDKVADKRQGDGADGPTTAVRSKIETSIIPAIHEVIEHMEGNPEVIERLSLIAEGLEDAGKRLGPPQNGSTTENYDIGKDDSGDEGGRSCRRKGAGGNSGCGLGDRPGEGRKDGKASAWKPEGSGRWTRRPADGGTRLQGDMATGNGGGDSATGTTRTSSSTRVATDENGDDVDSGEQAAKYRRMRTDGEARQESDARRAQELHQEQQLVMAAQTQSHQAGSGGFGSEVALSLAAQKYALEVRRTEARAARKGVEPKHEGKPLIELSPMELQQWARDSLGEESDADY